MTDFGDRGSPTGSTVGFAPVLCKPNMVYTVPPQRRGNPCGCPVAPMGPKTDGPPSMTSGARMLLRICALGVTMSWDEAPRERGRPARTNPGTASPISSTRIDRQRRQGSASARAHAVPAGRVAGCRIAGKLSGRQRERMRAGRPRSRGVSSRWCGGGVTAGDFSESRPASFGEAPVCPRAVPPLFTEPRPRPARRHGSYRTKQGRFRNRYFGPLLEILSLFPTLGASLLTLLQPLRGPSWITLFPFGALLDPLRGYLFLGLCDGAASD